MNEFNSAAGSKSRGPSAEVLAEIQAAYASGGALTAAGVDTYHLSTWTSRDFYGETNVEKVLLVKVQTGDAEGVLGEAVLSAVKQTGDTRVPGGWVSWVAIGVPAVGGAALNGVVQIRSPSQAICRCL